MSEYTGGYVVNELLRRVEAGKKKNTNLNNPNNTEKTLLGCLFIDAIDKLLTEAKLQAEKDGTRTISIENLREAEEILLSLARDEES